MGNQREAILYTHLVQDVHLISFTSLHLTIRLSHKAPPSLPQNLQTLLKEKTGEIWTIAISDEIGHPTLQVKELEALEEKKKALYQNPLVKTLITTFPGTSLVHMETQ